MERNIFFIVNPTAGRGKGSDIIDFIDGFFRDRNISYRICQTKKHKHAIELAKQAVMSNATDVIAIGGDGTASEVIRGIFGQQVRFGIFACGTGNDLARNLGMPADWPKQCQVFIDCATKRIDLGTIDDRIFVNSTGTGFDAAVAAGVNSSKARVSGFLAYFIYVIKELGVFERRMSKIYIEDYILERKPWLIAVTNGETYGAGMKICPGAINDDGLLDVCVVGDVSRWLILFYVPLIMMGRHRSLPKVEFFRTDKLSIDTDGYWVQADGEVFKAESLRFQVLPRALEVIVPREAL